MFVRTPFQAGMLEELHTASTLLCAALERYTNACSALRYGCSRKYSINSTDEILDVVTNELDIVESHRSKLIQAQVSVKQARNNLANVPINSLPAEVLTHIFHLVLAQQPCPLRVTDCWDSENPVTFPKYPDTLSHVCSRWRQIALASHTLWSHIDIALSCSLSQGFHDRAEVYVVRAYPTPLDIHFIDPGCIRPAEESELTADDSSSGLGSSGTQDRFDEWDDLIYENNPEEFSFLSSSEAPHVRSLGLLVHSQYYPIHSRAMEHCLTNCLPGVLSELFVRVQNEVHPIPAFFGTHSDPSPSADLFLSEQQLERAWGSVTTLHLKGRYPRWASAAYHGLTDLCLSGRMRLSVSEVVGVLRASPRLRILHCDFNITDLSESSNFTAPVVLQELETLDLRYMTETKVRHFLQLLSPGSNPLRLSFVGCPTSDLLKDFFSRSNVQEVRVERVSLLVEPELPPSMFYLPRQLRVLVIIRGGWGRPYGGVKTCMSPRLPNEALLPLELDTLYMLSCHCEDLHSFQAIVKRYSPRKLILWGCQLVCPNINVRPIIPVDSALLKSTLENDPFQHCPLIECLGYQDPCPLQDWY